VSAGTTVVVPCGGRGSRLRPLTLRRPKPLLPLAGATMLDHALAGLEGAAYDEAVLVVPPDDGGLRDHVARRGPARARFVVQPEPRGQADAVARALEGASGAALVLLPDTIHDVDVRALCALAADPAAPYGVLHVQRVADPARFGVAVLAGDRVARLVEKPAMPVSDLAVVGVYWLRDAALLAAACRAATARADGEAYLADALQRLLDAGAEVRAHAVRTWLDCGTLPDWLATNAALLGEGGGALGGLAEAASVDARGCEHIPPVWIAPTAVVTGSRLGPGAFVGAGARVEGSQLGPGVHVGEGARVSGGTAHRAIIGDRAVLSDAVLADAVLWEDGLVVRADREPEGADRVPPLRSSASSAVTPPPSSSALRPPSPSPGPAR